MSAGAADPASARPAFSNRGVAWMLGVGVIAFMGLIALAVFQPELRGGLDGGAHALSRSAVGFAGMVELLKERDVPVVVSRGPIPPANGLTGLVIQTPSVGTNMNKSRTDDRRRARLVILDKWFTSPDPLHQGWVKRGAPRPAYGPGMLAPQLNVPAAKSLKAVERRPGVSRPTVNGTIQWGDISPHALDPIDQFQTLDLYSGMALLQDEAGRTLLWRVDQNTFVLTDPDLMNNHGLASRRNAELAMAIIDRLRNGGPVVFDATLNGFVRTRSILRLAFGPPFLGATLCAVAAVLLMGFHAAARFGPAIPTERSLALGKRALVENSAMLIRLAKREAHMGSRYAAYVRRAVVKGLAFSREAAPRAVDAALDRLAHGDEPPFSALVAEAEGAKTEDQLMRAARALHQRKLEMTRERI